MKLAKNAKLHTMILLSVVVIVAMALSCFVVFKPEANAEITTNDFQLTMSDDDKEGKVIFYMEVQDSANITSATRTITLTIKAENATGGRVNGGGFMIHWDPELFHMVDYTVSAEPGLDAAGLSSTTGFPFCDESEFDEDVGYVYFDCVVDQNGNCYIELEDITIMDIEFAVNDEIDELTGVTYFWFVREDEDISAEYDDSTKTYTYLYGGSPTAMWPTECIDTQFTFSAPSATTDLTSLTVNGSAKSGTDLDEATLDFGSVDYSATSVTIQPVLSGASWSIDGGTPTQSALTWTLPTADPDDYQNPYTKVLTVYAQNYATSGATKQYTIQITRSKNSSSTLTSLSGNGVTILAEKLSTGTNDFGTVAFDASSVTFTASCPGATYKIDSADGLTWNLGTPDTANLELTATLTVYAQDYVAGTDTASHYSQYGLKVTREKSSNTTLESLSANGVTITGDGLNAEKLDFGSISYQTTSVTVTPVCAGATFALTGGGLTWNVPAAAGTHETTLTVTAQDGTTTKTYTLQITRNTDTTAKLESLEVVAKRSGSTDLTFNKSGTALAPALGNMGTVPYSTDKVNVKASAVSTASKVELSVNDSAVSATKDQIAAGVDVTLASGTNTIKLTVTAQDGTSTQDYTFTVTRTSAETTNSLNSLTVMYNGSNLLTGDQAFASNKENYTVSVPWEAEFITIHAKKNGNFSTLSSLDGIENDKDFNFDFSESWSQLDFYITVTAEDDTMVPRATTYRVTVKRSPANTDNTLKSLSVDGYTLDKAFDGSQTSYVLENQSTAITPTLTLNFEVNNSLSGAAITVDDGSVSGKQVTLNDGATKVITITVTAQDTSTKAYTITVNRSNKAELSALRVVDYDFAEGTFDAGTKSYHVTVPANVEFVTVAATASSHGSVTSGSGDTTLNAAGQTKNISVVVVSEDKTSTETYTIEVTRLSPAEVLEKTAWLSDLTLTAKPGNAPINFTPVFDKEKLTGYTASVDYTVSQVVVTANAAGKASVISGNRTWDLAEGATTTIVVEVQSQASASDGGCVNRYEIVVTRADRNSTLHTTAYLDSLSVSDYGISPSFKKNEVNYTVNVPYGTTQVTVNATNFENSQILSGTGVHTNLQVGNNTITVCVASENSVNTREYVITVVRAAQGTTLKETALLAALSLDKATLSPAFSSDIKSYTANIPNSESEVTVSASTKDNARILSGNGYHGSLGEGENTIEIKVISEDSKHTSTYTITVIRAAHNETLRSTATLSSLTLSANGSDVTLVPGFSADTYTGYVANVANNVTSITLTAVPADGAKLQSQEGASRTFSLPNVGNNTISVTVLSEDGSNTKTYEIIVKRAAGSLDDRTVLASLNVTPADKISLSPAFNGSIDAYSATVDNAVDSITIGATAAYNGLIPTAQLGTFDLKVGLNVFTITVHSQDGKHQKDYTISITRSEQGQVLSSDASLASLSLGDISFTPAFDAKQHTYTATVANDVTQAVVSATPVEGASILSGVKTWDLVEGGLTVINIVVQAEDGTQQPYVIAVTRAAADVVLDSTAELASLEISNVTLSPAFDAATTSYTASVSKEVENVTVNATAKNPAKIYSGDGPYTLNFGANTIDIVVQAQDGTQQTYSVVITRVNAEELSDVALLNNLKLNNGAVALSPAFDKDTTQYTATVAKGTPSVNVLATPVDTATIHSGDGEITLIDGTNVVSVVVMAQDGLTTKTYTVIITRISDAELDNTALLDLLVLSGTSLSPAFSAGITSYTATVPYTTSRITVSATAKSPASIVEEPLTVDLAVGSNVLSVKVLAQDGKTSRTYTITVTREAEVENPQPENEAALSALSISEGTLSPAFDPATLSYTASVASGVASLNVSATAAGKGSVKSGLGTQTLSIGSNVLKVVVVAEDGKTSVTYTIVVTRSAEPVVSNVALLQTLTVSEGTLTPAFDAGITSYTVNVEHDIDILEVSAVAQLPGTVVSGAGSCLLKVGATAINVVVAAEDGTERTYTIVVTRANAPEVVYEPLLGSLTVDGIALSPAFDEKVLAYTATVDNSVEKVIVAAAGKTGSDAVLTGTGEQTLEVGANTIVIRVKRGDATKDYTVIITRSASATLSNVALLDNLSLSDGSLSPAFSAGVYNYTAVVENDIEKVYVSAIAKTPATLVSGYGWADLKVGSNTINVVVAAEDGTEKTYSVAITRKTADVALSDIAQLATLSVSDVTLAFAPTTLNYNANVANSVASVTVSATAADKGKVISGTGTFDLDVGANILYVKVQAEDGTIATYTITIVRAGSAALDGNAVLDSLMLVGATLDTEFDPATLSYTATVANSVDSVSVIAVAKAPAMLLSANGAQALDVGANVILVKVQAEDGTIATYTITITRESAPVPSSDADLASLAISAGTLSPAFSANVLNYTAEVANEVESLTVTASAKAPATLISGNGSHDLVVGSNVILVKVQAEDGTMGTYTITVTRAAEEIIDPKPENIAELSALTLSGGAALSPAFDPATLGYTVTVANSVKSLTVTATAQGSGTVKSGNGKVNLEVGMNVVSILVEAEDKVTTRTYTILITREAEPAPAPQVAELSALTISAGTLSPEFDAATLAYTAKVGNAIDSLTINATALADGSVKSGNGEHALAVGANVLKVVVESADKSLSKTYTITVTREGEPVPSSDADLASLAISAGKLSPAFSAGTLDYTASVANTVESITVSASAMYPAKLVSGTGTFDLDVGANVLLVKVQAEDGTVNTYTITVTRAAEEIIDPQPENEAALSALAISAGTLSPAFDEATLAYTAKVGNTVDSLTITAAAKGNGTVKSGDGAQTLKVGANVLKVVVEAEDKVTTKTYTITVTREGAPELSSDADLASLAISTGTLTPAFSASELNYTVNVANEVESLTVTATAKASATLLSGNGAQALSVGSNVLLVKVQAEDGTINTYTITVIRAAAEIIDPKPENEAALSALTISVGTLSPAFAENTLSYTASVDNEVDSLTITATAKGNGTVKSGDGERTLTVGVNVLNIVVEAEDGETTSTYTIIVNRVAAPAPVSSVAALNWLSVEGVTLSPAFSSTQLSYSATVANGVDSVNVLATAKANGTVSGTGLKSLTVGANTINLVVTAEDGETKANYSISIIREGAPVPSSDADLASLAISTGTLTPAFSASELNYTVNVANEVESLTVTATAKAPATLLSGNGAQALSVGSNVLLVKVQAEDGTINTYTITVIRAAAEIVDPKPENEAALSALTISEGTLSPAFAENTLSYTASVDNEFDSLTITATAKGNGTVKSGDGERTLTVGVNVLNIVVEAEDGETTSTYTIIVNRAAAPAPVSSVAALNWLSIDEVELNPAFNANTFSYSATVANGVNSIMVRATAKANGTVAGDGTQTLNVGANTINLVVTAEDGKTTATYTINVTRSESAKLSDVALLDSLTLSSGVALSPAFAAGIFNYTASVDNEISSVTVTAMAQDNGKVLSGAGLCALSVGTNVISIVVESEDGKVSNTYNIAVTRAAAPDVVDEALLSYLGIGVAMSPAFSENVTYYTATVVNGIASVNVSATAKGNANVISGTGAVDLEVGSNVLEVVVEAKDGSTKTYTIVVERSAAPVLSSVALLDSLAISEGTLSPEFAEGTTTYTATVANEIDSVNVSAFAKAPATLVSGAGSHALEVGSNAINILVRAEDGTERTYTITITREAAATAEVALLSNLTISAGTLSPAFSENTLSYTATVANGISSVTVSATAKGTATVVAGAGSHSLAVGANTISVKVEATDGSSTTYSIVITRSAAIVLSNVAQLDSLKVSDVALNPTFAANVYNYIASVDNEISSVSVEAIAKVPAQLVSGNGTVELDVGSNVLKVVVKAEDGTNKTYTITIIRALEEQPEPKPESEALLASLSLKDTAMSPEFDEATLSYTALVANGTDSVEVLATAKGNASIVSGTGIQNLVVGVNTLRIVVVAEDEVTTVTYTITVTRAAVVPAADSTAELESLSLSDGELTFAATTYDYDVDVDADVDSLTVYAKAKAPGEIIWQPGTVSLNFGANVLLVKVLAEDGVTEHTYKITVTRNLSNDPEPSADATLADLDLIGASLSPAFAASTFAYTATVGNNITSVQVIASAKGNATIVSGTGTHNLTVGLNTLEIVVMAEDGKTSLTYTITVTRKAADPEKDHTAELTALSVAGGDINLAFSAETLAYTATVASDVTSVILNATAKAPATITSKLGTWALNFGANVLEVVVLAEDGVTTATYTITITRELEEQPEPKPESEALLSDLSAFGAALSPEFAENVFAYTAVVENSIKSVNISATAKGTAKVIFGTGEFALNDGINTFAVKVQAEDGTIVTYTITIERKAADPEKDHTALLDSLSVDGGGIILPFAAGVMEYSFDVANDVTSVILAATAKAPATIISNLGEVQLNVGANVLTVKVLAEDGETNRTYTITITRALPKVVEPSAEALLSALSIENMEGAIEFAEDTFSYALTVTNDITSVNVLAQAKGKATIVSGTGVTNLVVGVNTITIKVLAEDKETTAAYTITVTRSATETLSDVALLESLTLSVVDLGVDLKPTFSATTYNYTATVAHDVTSVNVDAIAQMPGKLVSGTGRKILEYGSNNTIRIVVAAEDGTQRTYIVVVTRELPPVLSSEAKLASLLVSGIELDFDADDLYYTATVASSVTSVTVTAEAKAPATLLSGNGAFELTYGANTLLVKVQAEDGTVATYTIDITRELDAEIEVALSGLEIDDVELSPEFAANKLYYTATVAHDVEAVVVNATAAKGSVIVSGEGECKLDEGANAINIVVASEDDENVTLTYSVVITRESAPVLEKVALLASLEIAGVTLSPAFAADVTKYFATVSNLVETVTVSAKAAGKATITEGNGEQELKVGENQINIVVVAEDGETTVTYSVVITRAEADPTKDHTALLADLSVSAGEMSPAFSAGLTYYTVKVGHAVDSLVISATAQEPGTITLKPGTVDLKVGSNVFTIRVLAEDGTTERTYTLVVERECAPIPSSEALLKSLDLGDLEIEFSEETFEYALNVENDVKSVTVSATAKGNATILAGLGDQALSTGANVILVKVQAEDGVTTNVYKVTITRAAAVNPDPKPENEAALKDLTISEGTLSPEFDEATLAYTAEVANGIKSVTIEATAKGNGTVKSGNGAQDLAVGANLVEILVESEDKSETKKYTIVITRAAEELPVIEKIALLETLEIEGISIDFKATTLSYSATVANDVASVTVAAKAQGKGTVISGEGEHDLVIGLNIIEIVVQAEDENVVNTYTVAINRVDVAKLSDVALLESLSVENATLNTAFAAGITKYTASVAFGVASVTVHAVAQLPGNVVSGAGVHALAVGANVINVVVEAEDGTTRTYEIAITREGNPAIEDKAWLESLAVEEIALSPVFNRTSFIYNATVANDVETINILATAAEGVEIDGIGEQELKVGVNNFNVVVSADGSARTYTITITRSAAEVLSDVALLEVLEVSDIELAFDANTFLYKVNVPFEVASVNVHAVAQLPATVRSGAGNYNLVIGANTIDIVVVAEDGTTNTYKVVLTRANEEEPEVPDIAWLENLYIHNVHLSPLFETETMFYSATVPNTMESINIMATAKAGATVTGDGEHALDVGNNVFEVIVSANGIARKYTLEIKREQADPEKSHTALLGSLSVDKAPIAPAFAAGLTEYSVTVDDADEFATILATALDNGKIISEIGLVKLGYGANVFTIRVLAEDGVTTRDYTLTINRPQSEEPEPSSVALLAMLKVIGAELDKQFDAQVFAYSAIVPFGTTSVNVNASAEGNAYVMSAGIGRINLLVGTNVIKVVVVAEDGVTTATYTVTIIRSENKVLSNVALLDSLEIEGIAISPAFAAGIESYKANVANDVASININAVAQMPGRIVSNLGEIKLEVGANVINVMVEAEDGTTRTYSITVVRALPANPTPSTEALLSNLGLEGISIAPAFRADILSYNVTVANDVDSVTVEAEAKGSATIVSGIGATALVVGNNVITVKVLAEDGETSTIYSIIVKRSEAKVLSSVALLESLSVEGATLDQAFAEGITNYTATVPYSVSRVSVEAVAKMPGAILSGLGNATLAVGSNVISIVVRAEDGTERNYSITIIREADETVAEIDTAWLSNLAIEGVALNAKFDEKVLSYKATVENDVESVNVIATPKGTAKVVSGNGEQKLQVGSNIISIEVSNADGSVSRKYTINVIRSEAKALSNVALLETLKVVGANIAPAFAAGVTNYSATVSSDVTSVSVSAIAQLPGTILDGIGTYDLAIGANVINIRVQAEDGTIRTYTITILREGPVEAATEALLSSLNISEGTLSPAFAERTLAYTVTVANGIKSIEIDAKAKGTATVISGNGAHDLEEGINIIKIVVSTDDGLLTRTYTLTVVRSLSPVLSNVALLDSLEISDVTLSPTFSPVVTAYTMSVTNDISYVNISAIARMPGEIVSGTGIKDLEVGANVFRVVVRAEDGTTRTYTITIKRSEDIVLDSDASLAELSVSKATLAPAFDPALFNYSATVACDVDAVDVFALASGKATVIGGSGIAQLKYGSNTISVVVQAEDGTINTYTIIINREEVEVLDDSALLASLEIDGVMLSPAFAANRFEYEMTVANEVDSVTISAEAQAPASILSGIGTFSLNEGRNSFAIVVLAQDGVHQQEYTVVINRHAESAETTDTFEVSLKDSEGNELLTNADASGDYMITLDEAIGDLVLKVVADGEYAIATINGIGSGKSTTMLLAMADLAKYPSANTYNIAVQPAQGDANTCTLTIIVRVAEEQPFEGAVITFLAGDKEYDAQYSSLWDLYMVEFPAGTDLLNYRVNIPGIGDAGILVGDDIWAQDEALAYDGSTMLISLHVLLADGSIATYEIQIKTVEQPEEVWLDFTSTDSDVEIDGISMYELLDEALKIIERSIAVEVHVSSVSFKTNALPASTIIQILYQGSVNATANTMQMNRRCAVNLTPTTGDNGVVWEFDISGLVEGKNIIVYSIFDEALHVSKAVVLEIWKPITGVEIPAVPVNVAFATAQTVDGSLVLQLTDEAQLTNDSLKALLITVTYSDGSIITAKANELGATVVADTDAKTITVRMNEDSSVTNVCGYEEVWNRVIVRTPESVEIVDNSLVTIKGKNVLQFTNNDQLSEEALQQLLIKVKYTDEFEEVGTAKDLGATVSYDKTKKQVIVTMNDHETIVSSCSAEIVKKSNNTGLIVSLVLFILIAVAAGSVMVLFIIKWKNSEEEKNNARPAPAGANPNARSTNSSNGNNPNARSANSNNSNNGNNNPNARK